MFDLVLFCIHFVYTDIEKTQLPTISFQMDYLCSAAQSSVALISPSFYYIENTTMLVSIH